MKNTLSLLLLGFLWQLAGAQQLDFSGICDKNAAVQAEFKSGEFIFAHLRMESPFMSMLDLSGANVTFQVEISENGKVLEYEDLGLDATKFKGIQTPGYIVLPIISNPDDNCVSYKKNLFASYLPKAFAGLSAGEHNLQCKISCYNYKDGKVALATGNFKLTVAADAKAWYNKNANLAYKAMAERGVTSHLEKFAASNNSSSAVASTVKISFKSSNEARIKIYTGAGASQEVAIQQNVSTSAYSLQVGSKIELLQTDAPYSKVRDIFTVSADMNGKTLEIK